MYLPYVYSKAGIIPVSCLILLTLSPTVDAPNDAGSTAHTSLAEIVVDIDGIVGSDDDHVLNLPIAML
jgi:hypothetical protein